MRQLPHRTGASFTEIEKHSTTIPTTIEEGQIQAKSLGSAAGGLQAEPTIAQEGRHRALSREKSARKSRKVLSLADYVTQADLQITHHAQEEQVPLKRKRATDKATGECLARRRRPRHHTKDSDVIGVADSNVEREVEALMERDEEGQEEQQEERPPLAKTSANVQRWIKGNHVCTWCLTGGQQRNQREGKVNRFMRGHSL
jgi:hypothetical protein